MPACHRCGKANQPTVEVRRTRLGHVCKERLACLERQHTRRREERRARLIPRRLLDRRIPQAPKSPEHRRAWRRRLALRQKRHFVYERRAA